jgi:hypothetical protein
MTDIDLPTSLKSACWAHAEQDIATDAAAVAAFLNQEILIKVKRNGGWDISKNGVIRFPNVDF